MKIAIKLYDAYRKQKRGWHASSRIRGHWLADNWDELDDIFYPDYFKQEYHSFFEIENQLRLLKDYDVVIFHKTYEWKLAKELREQGKKVIIDFSDPDYILGFSNLARASQCLMTMENSNAIVVNLLQIKNDLKIVGKPVVYIPDRIDFKKFEPKKEHKEKIEELAWFGHSDNFTSILPYVEQIIRKYKLKIIADKGIKGTEFVAYHPDTINGEIVKSDLVILGDKIHPYKFDDENPLSDNRKLTAMALGMPVIRMPKEIFQFLDKDKREEEVKNNNELIKDWGVEQSVKEWKELINKL